MEASAAALFSSKRMDWPTPASLYNHILKELMIKEPLELDVCASAENTKCQRYFDEEQNGLTQSWERERCWMNPPYGRDIGLWTAKAARKDANLLVALLPARTDTLWWHRDVIARAMSIYFIKGRVKFEGADSSAPFPSAVVTWERKFYPYSGPLYGSFDAS